MPVINREALLDVLDKYIPQLVAGGVVFVKHPTFDMSTASEGRVYRYMRVLKLHCRVLRKSLPSEEEELAQIVHNFNADISAVAAGSTPPYMNAA